MSILRPLARRLLGVTAACSMMAVAAPGHAGGVIASFDPAFGPDIPNLGFRGSITLDVTPGCYALGTGFHFTGGSCSITAESAIINYYNATTGSATLTTVTLPGTFFAGDYVFGAYFDPTTGALAGLDTDNSDLFGVSVTDTNPLAPIAYTGDMYLYFSSGFVPPSEPERAEGERLPASPAGTTPGVGGAFLVNCGPTGGECEGDASNTSLPGTLSFTTVPEPGSLSLGLLGLVALVAARRRTRVASAGRSRAV